MADDENEELAATQRLQQLEAMVEKRTANFGYMRRIHAGGAFWLNCVLISPDELQSYVKKNVPEQRTIQYFYLAISLGKLLDMSDGPVFIRALGQLIEEFEYHFNISAIRLAKYATARHSECVYPQLSVLNTAIESTESSDGMMRTGLFRFNNEVVYMHLITPHIPFTIDYVEVIHSLCDVLVLVYHKLEHSESWQCPAVYDMLVRVDSRIKHHIINRIAKELTDLSITILRRELYEYRIHPTNVITTTLPNADIMYEPATSNLPNQRDCE